MFGLKFYTFVLLLGVVSISVFLRNQPHFIYPTPDEASTLMCQVGQTTTWQYTAIAGSLPFGQLEISMARHPNGVKLSEKISNNGVVTIDAEWTPYSYQSGVYNIVISVKSSILPFGIYSQIIHFDLVANNSVCNNGELNLNYNNSSDDFCMCRDGFTPNSACTACADGYYGDQCLPISVKSCENGGVFNISAMQCDCPDNWYGELCQLSISSQKYCSKSNYEPAHILASFGDNDNTYLSPAVQQIALSSSPNKVYTKVAFKQSPYAQIERNSEKRAEVEGAADSDKTKLDIYLLFDLAMISQDVILEYYNGFEKFLLLSSGLFPDTQFGLGYINSNANCEGDELYDPESAYRPVMKIGQLSNRTLDRSIFHDFFVANPSCMDNRVGPVSPLIAALSNESQSIGWRADAVRSLMYFAAPLGGNGEDPDTVAIANQLLADQYIAIVQFSSANLDTDPYITNWKQSFKYGVFSNNEAREWVKSAIRCLKIALDLPMILNSSSGSFTLKRVWGKSDNKNYLTPYNSTECHHGNHDWNHGSESGVEGEHGYRHKHRHSKHGDKQKLRDESGGESEGENGYRQSGSGSESEGEHRPRHRDRDGSEGEHGHRRRHRNSESEGEHRPRHRDRDGSEGKHGPRRTHESGSEGEHGPRRRHGDGSGSEEHGHTYHRHGGDHIHGHRQRSYHHRKRCNDNHSRDEDSVGYTLAIEVSDMDSLPSRVEAWKPGYGKAVIQFVYNRAPVAFPVNSRDYQNVKVDQIYSIQLSDFIGDADDNLVDIQFQSVKTDLPNSNAYLINYLYQDIELARPLQPSTSYNLQQMGTIYFYANSSSLPINNLNNKPSSSLMQPSVYDDHRGRGNSNGNNNNHGRVPGGNDHSGNRNHHGNGHSSDESSEGDYNPSGNHGNDHSSSDDNNNNNNLFVIPLIFNFNVTDGCESVSSNLTITLYR